MVLAHDLAIDQGLGPSEAIRVVAGRPFKELNVGHVHYFLGRVSKHEHILLDRLQSISVSLIVSEQLDPDCDIGVRFRAVVDQMNTESLLQEKGGGQHFVKDVLDHVLTYLPVAVGVQGGLRGCRPHVIELPVDGAHRAILDRLVGHGVKVRPLPPELFNLEFKALALLNLGEPDVVLEQSLVADLVDRHLIVHLGNRADCPPALLVEGRPKVGYFGELAPILLGERLLIVEERRLAQESGLAHELEIGWVNCIVFAVTEIEEFVRIVEGSRVGVVVGNVDARVSQGWLKRVHEEMSVAGEAFIEFFLGPDLAPV